MSAGCTAGLMPSETALRYNKLFDGDRIVCPFMQAVRKGSFQFSVNGNEMSVI